MRDTDLADCKMVIPKLGQLQSSPWSQEAVLPSNKLHIPFNIRAETSAYSLDSERCCSYSKLISCCFVLVLKFKKCHCFVRSAEILTLDRKGRK